MLFIKSYIRANQICVILTIINHEIEYYAGEILSKCSMFTQWV